MQAKIMLADDHPLFMEGLQYILATYGIEVIGTAKNGREAFEKARILKPDIILMDIRMPEYNGLDALRLIKAELPRIKVVMLTISEEDDDLFEAMKFGASGYLLKNTDAKDLIDMLASLENDEAPLSTGLAAKLLNEFKRNNTREDKHLQDVSTTQKDADQATAKNLTERQLEVLEMAARGITYKEVGEKLGLTERTVKYHMGRIIELLHMENRAQVIAYSARIGLVNNETDNGQK